MTTKQIETNLVIVSSDRVRKKFDQEKLRRLASSFQRFGQLQPGVCREQGDQIILVAGERRLRACELAGLPYKYELLDEVDPLRLKEIELEENLCRENLSWQEEVDGKDELHKLKQEIHGGTEYGKAGGHGIKDTAALLDESVGKTAEDLELAAFSKHFEEVREAKRKTDAKKIVKRIKEELNRKEKLGEALEKEANKEVAEGKEPLAIDLSEDDRQLLFYSKQVILGKMEEKLLDFEDGFFDIAIFDPPWGVDIDKVRKKGGGTNDFQEGDSPENFLAGIEDWLGLLYKKMAGDSILYMFFGITHYEIVYEMAEKKGFRTNRLPIIWFKQGAHVTRNPDIWPGRSYEPILYGRKGNKTLVRKGQPDVILTPSPSPSLKKNHPTAKHPNVILDLLQRTAEPGDKILDPMCGSGMTGVACETLRVTHKLEWWMIEEKKEFRELSIMNLVEGYSRIINPPKTEYKIPQLPEDFKKLEPGSDEWKRYWRASPEEVQGQMLEWKKGREK